MKKIAYFILILLFIGACKFADNPYSFEREFGNAYVTPEGIVKYISGTRDSAVTVSDNYAVIQERIDYHKPGAQQGDGTVMHLDSILIYGHVFSETPNPSVLKPEVTKLTGMDDLNDNIVMFYNGASKPQSFISITDLGAGITFKSSLGLLYETEYYIRSFVITGRFVSGEPVFNDVAYNQYELQILTDTPVDLWVGEDMDNAPDDFYDNTYWGGTSFTYNGKLYVAQGHDEGGLSENLVVYEFDPTGDPTSQWQQKYSKLIGNTNNFTNAVSFVIEDVQLEPNTTGALYDCAYIGLGLKQDGTCTKSFYRINLESETGDITEVAPNNYSSLIQQFDGSSRHNAVAFVIDGIAYIGLGTLGNGTVISEFTMYEPNNFSEGHYYGTWTRIGDFDNAITKAAVFQIGDDVYLCGGENDVGQMNNNLWRGTQTSDNRLDWVSRRNFPGTARVDHVAFSIGENGYVGTGWDGDSARSDFYRYDPRINEWEQRAYFGGLARYEAISGGIRISDNDYRGYIGTGWAGTPSIDFGDFWHYRP